MDHPSFSLETSALWATREMKNESREVISNSSIAHVSITPMPLTIGDMHVVLEKASLVVPATEAPISKVIFDDAPMNIELPYEVDSILEEQLGASIDGYTIDTLV